MSDLSIAGVPAAVLWTAALVLKATLVLAAAGALTALLRHASAALRHLVWSGALGALLVLPLLSASLPWRLPLAVAPAAAVASEAPPVAGPPAPAPTAPHRPASPAHSAGHPAGSTGGVIAPAAARPWSPSLLDVALAIWAVGALALLGRLLLGGWKLRRLVRRAECLSGDEWRIPLAEAGGRLALDRLPQLVMASGPPMPFACGLLRPAIVLPRRAAEWDERRRRAVLCHELAHVRRADLRVNAAAQVAAAVFWFHPLAWIALRRLRLESERACDDLVLASGTRPSEYADHLLQIVAAIRRTPVPAVALPLARRQEFEGRVLAILERGVERRPTSRWQAFVLSGVALSFVLPLAALVPVRSPGSAPPAVPAVRQPTTSTPAAVPAPMPRAVPVPVAAPLRTASGGEAAKRIPAVGQTLEHAASGDTANTSVVSSLLGALGDRVADVRKNAAYALGHLEAHAAVPGLARALSSDPDPDVREMSGWALGEIQDSAGVPALAAAVRSDTAGSVRLISVWALAELESRSAAPALVDALRDRSADVRERAAWALGTIQPSAAPASLVAALHDATPEVRSEAAWALGQIGDPQALTAVGGAIGDSDTAVRRAVIWALGRLGGDTAQGILVRALQDPDPALRSQAARALGGNDSNPWPQPMPIVR